jgi:hypothetical protein
MVCQFKHQPFSKIAECGPTFSSRFRFPTVQILVHQIVC